MRRRDRVSRLMGNPCTASCLGALLLWAAAWGSEQLVRPGSYDITARTVMPHLEESLRYTVTQERRCLSNRDLPDVFPVLRYPSLEGCKLGNERRRGEDIRYALVCENPEVATGIARLSATRGRIVGVLEIKMGGKNMTFSQRVEATRRGDCEAGREESTRPQ